MAAMLRETIRREGLQARVAMPGAVPSEGVRDILVPTPLSSTARHSPAKTCSCELRMNAGMQIPPWSSR